MMSNQLGPELTGPSDAQVMAEADALSDGPRGDKSGIIDIGGDQYKGIVVVRGPWTKEAKHIAAQRETRAYAHLFVAEAMNNPTLNWHPRLFERTRQETRDRAHLLKPRTQKTLIDFIGTELRVGDYTEAGLNAVDDGNARIMILTSWGLMESFHVDLTLQGAQDSNIITERQRYHMEQEAREISNRWNPDDHRIGEGKPLHYVAYGWVQEGDTQAKYALLRTMVREDYGLPVGSTKFERDRGYEIGLCDPINGIKGQESFHFVSYGEIIAINIRYRPGEMLDALDDIFFNRFSMPMVGRIPHGMDTARYLFSKNLDGLDESGEPLSDFSVGKKAVTYYREMFEKRARQRPLGFEGRRGLREAMNNLKVLDQHGDPGMGILLPDGSFKPIPKEDR